jgi:5'-nucleotidase
MERYMQILITNDDGIHAAGIAALEAAARRLGADVSVVAPAQEQSMCGHRVTTREPLLVEQLAEQRWTVAGTPADCVRVALYGLKLRPDWVLSGINHGGNMGQDAVISGTVAAAREAAYHRVRSVALSHYIIGGIPFDWSRMELWAAELLEELMAQPLGDGEFWNANFPHLAPGQVPLPERVCCKPARSPLNVGFRPVEGGYLYDASYAERPQDAGSDVEAAFAGKVAVSRLSV